MTTLVYDNNSFFNFNSSFNSLLDGIMEKVPDMLGPDSPPMASNAVTENVVVTETIQQTTVAPSDVILDDPGLTTEPTFQTRPKPLNHNLRRFMKESWFRPVALASAAILAIGVTFAIGSLSQKDTPLDKKSQMDVVDINQSKTGEESLSPQQAEFLRQKQAALAEQNEQAGVTNAPAVIIPTATTADTTATSMPIDTNQSDASGFKKKDALVNPNGAPANQANALPPDINDPNKYQKVGSGSDTYYIEKSTQRIIVPPNQAFTETKPAPIVQPGNGTATAMTANTGGTGGAGGAGGTGGAGGNGSGDPTYTVDPTIQRLRDEVKANFDQQQQAEDAYNQQQQQAQLQAQQQQMQQQQALMQQRQQMAANALNSQVQTLSNNGQATGGGFSTKAYRVNPSNYAINGNVNIGQPQYNDYTRRNNGENVQFNNSMSVSGAGTSNTNFNSANTGVANNTSSQYLPSNVIRAGTSWPVVITKEVNTDEGLQVIGRIMSGKFANSTVYGMVQPTGRNIGVVFDRIAPTNPRKPIIPVNAIATTIGTQKQAVATKVSKHYLQNYSVIAAESIFEGYQGAYAGDVGGTTVTAGDGTTITTKPKPNSEIIRGKVIGSLSGKLNNDVAALGNRAPTFEIGVGTVLNMMLMNDFDVTQTVSDLGGGSNTQGGSGGMGGGNYFLPNGGRTNTSYYQPNGGNNQQGVQQNTGNYPLGYQNSPYSQSNQDMGYTQNQANGYYQQQVQPNYNYQQQ